MRNFPHHFLSQIFCKFLRSHILSHSSIFSSNVFWQNIRPWNLHHSPQSPAKKKAADRRRGLPPPRGPPRSRPPGRPLSWMTTSPSPPGSRFVPSAAFFYDHCFRQLVFPHWISHFLFLWQCRLILCFIDIHAKLEHLFYYSIKQHPCLVCRWARAKLLRTFLRSKEFAQRTESLLRHFIGYMSLICFLNTTSRISIAPTTTSLFWGCVNSKWS